MTGLAEAATGGDYDALLRPRVAPTVGEERVVARPPPDARLADRYDLDTGATVRLYERGDDPLPTYHLTPVELTLDTDATATLAAAADHLAANALAGERAAGRAVRAVADPDDPVETLTAVLDKHTRGLGVLDDVFADPAVSDAYASAPVGDGPLRLERADVAVRSNLHLTPAGAAALASRFRRESGRAFSRADSTLDAAVASGDRELRVAGVTDPVSDGHGFAFRAHDGDPFRLADLVANGTLTPAVAGLLSVAVERGAAVLLAGGRGVGKTTTLGALLFELAAGTRTVVVEDTPELPVDALRAAGRDCQRLRVARDGDGVGPTEALRAALRLGEGALVVGEVRGPRPRRSTRRCASARAARRSGRSTGTAPRPSASGSSPTSASRRRRSPTRTSSSRSTGATRRGASPASTRSSAARSRRSPRCSSATATASRRPAASNAATARRSRRSPRPASSTPTCAAPSTPDGRRSREPPRRARTARTGRTRADCRPRGRAPAARSVGHRDLPSRGGRAGGHGRRRGSARDRARADPSPARRAPRRRRPCSRRARGRAPRTETRGGRTPTARARHRAVARLPGRDAAPRDADPGGRGRLRRS
ncbi:ATPase, T2SS/T4P/T4SS family [Halosegnis marinus]|uniref:ATPase, T2SS/T4P/T4SS family n=1 Tax=Halosegnis marinus TaxID=3034023 RepID=UPI00361081DF